MLDAATIGRRGRVALLAVASLALAACATSRTTRVESAGSVSDDVIPVNASVLPAGATLQATLDQTLGTKQSKVGDGFTASKVGDGFTATVQNAVAAQNGATVVPAGATIRGHVTALEASKNVADPSVIRLDFDQLAFGGRSYPFQASVERAAPRQVGGDSRNETLQKAGIGAAAGAVLGAVLGDADLKHMTIGAVLGAAAGTAISLGTGTVDAVLPAGTTLELRATQAVALR